LSGREALVRFTLTKLVWHEWVGRSTTLVARFSDGETYKLVLQIRKAFGEI